MAVTHDARTSGPGRWAPRPAWLLWALTLSGLAVALWLDSCCVEPGART